MRVIVRDDVSQAQTALRVLAKADAIFVPLPCLCEFAWVLDRTFGYSREDVAAALRGIVDRANVEADTLAVEAGLRMLKLGGDFADGVIASAGAAMGADNFVSFDRKAVERLMKAGLPAQLATAVA